MRSGEENTLTSMLIASTDPGVSTKYHIASTGPKRMGTVTVGAILNARLTSRWKGAGFMPLTRGEAVGYDADLMAFKFTMRNGQQIMQCQISRAALGDLAGGWTAFAARDLPAQFEAHREFIEAIASAQFDQTSNAETRLVCIYAKHLPTSTGQK